MATRRRYHAVTSKERRQSHLDWLELISVSGPFLSVPVLTAEWPDLEALETDQRDRIHQMHSEWQDGDRDGWIAFILSELLGWQGAVCRDDLQRLRLLVPDHETEIIPSFTLNDPASDEIRLLGLISDGSPVARIKGSDWPATPADRLAQLCRHHRVELGLATDGRWWALVWASAEGVTTVAVFDAIAWPESAERPMVRAFISLLQRRRFFSVPQDRQLPALFRQSVKHQENITDRLGIQVRQAVELLVAAFGRAHIGYEVTAAEIYRGAITVMMRLLFVLFAEESGLFPADRELYVHAYSAGGLYANLEQRVADANGHEADLDHTCLAWHRLLALSTAIYRGVSHSELGLIAYGGSLFDPCAYPWFPLTVDDRTVLHILQAVQTVIMAGELRKVSFRTLTVEQIGYVYEGLLSFEAYRAAEVTVGLVGREGSERKVPLRELESAVASSPELAADLAVRYKDAGIGSARALAVKLAALKGDESAQAETRLYAITHDHALVRRLLPFYRIIRKDLRGDPIVIVPGELYVAESALRARSGTHYTPRHLADQVAEGALEPLVYSPGPLQTADRTQWKLKNADEILTLKVADIAMGSGTFLVAACRYLAAKVIEAWSADGNVDASVLIANAQPESSLALDVTADPLVIKARRKVIQHCLYGVDINPVAVEIAKFSLWLVSMDPNRPFTFVDDHLIYGDSLLGITSIQQLERMDLDPNTAPRLHKEPKLDFLADIDTTLQNIASERERLVDIPDDDISDINKKRQILSDASADAETLICYADLLVGAALAKSVSRTDAVHIARTAASSGSFAQLNDQACLWLRTDQPNGAFDRRPIHWPIVFPEVFASRRHGAPGFDAIIGNPPFLGGQKLTGTLGSAYREYLVERIGKGARGSADLIAYFLLRVHQLLNRGGQTGLIATNTLAQGDTREVGLDQVVRSGTEIRRAVKSKPWPSKGAMLEYSAVWTSCERIAPSAERVADGVVTKLVVSSLDPASRVTGNPNRLVANAGKSFQGSIILGLGFTMEPRRAVALIGDDPRNREVLFPYLNGQDLTTRPDCSASRWVVNFHDWAEEKANTYREPYAQVLREVKPERARSNRQARRERWWQYAERARGLYDAIAGLDQVLVIARVSKFLMPVMVSTGQVMNEQTVVFTTDNVGILALLSSAPHYWWAVDRSSTLETRIRYTPSNVFETLPLPEITDEMRQLGDRLGKYRRKLMLSRQAGLTATYNLVHKSSVHDADIAELRDIHRLIDEEVVRAYGWDDLLVSGLDHGFHKTRQGTRYTIGPVVRQEILDRLLELNHDRYAAE